MMKTMTHGNHEPIHILTSSGSMNCRVVSDMGTPPVFCVGWTQGIFSDTGGFKGEFVLMGGFPWGKQGVFFLYERPKSIESY